MLLHVHITHAPVPIFLAHLQGLLDERIQLTFGTEAPADPCYTWLVSDKPSVALLEASPHLQAIIIPYAGVPVPTRQIAQQRGLKLYNLHHNSDSTAEFAFSLLLAATKRIPQADAVFRHHDWRPRHDPMPALILHGKTAVVLGYGAIGWRVGRMCKGLGMHVVGVKRTIEQTDSLPPYADEVYSIESLAELLPRADALLICLPLTDQTRGLIGAGELALLPKTAVLVNVGRAAIVEEESLYEALHAGRLFGAAFDVWYQYPEGPDQYAHFPPSQFPFHELPNMVLSPHRAGGVETDSIEYNRMAGLAEILNAALRGDSIPNEVDLIQGY